MQSKASAGPACKTITWVADNIGYRLLAGGKRSYCFHYYDAEGKERTKFLGAGSTERLAREKLAEVVVKKSRGELPRETKLTFAEFAPKWLERQVDLEQSTLDLYELQLRVHLIPFFGRHRLTKIDAPLVADFILQQKRKKHAGT